MMLLTRLLKCDNQILKLQPDEALARRIFVSQKTGQEDLINEAAKDASPEVLYYTFLNLMDDGNVDLANKIKSFIKEDSYLTPLIEQRTAK